MRSFDDFLAALSSRKRKAIRKERAAALDGLTVEHVTGAAIDGGALGRLLGLLPGHRRRANGAGPISPGASSRCSASGWRTACCSIFALRDGVPIAGALNLIGADTLYGRYWGAIADVPNLHFEICYYQAIDAAIARGLARVEAGAQGQHKLSRGYRPVPTWSAHFIPDPDFRRAVAEFLAAERPAVIDEIGALDEMAPFRKGWA